ncbi:hypothetical protein AB6A40_009884 [Gnathostoma spinigerum]|uniref:Uncharacterized protein n=1 Tax=Gnathostoma spinigerum TaxID=75299 RepID=A0ABD6F2C1_9BILA
MNDRLSLRHRSANSPRRERLSDLSYEPSHEPGLNFCTWILVIISYIVLVLTLPFSAYVCIKVGTFPCYKLAIHIKNKSYDLRYV